MSQQSFRALGVSAEIVQALGERGIEAPFPIQTLVVPDALAGGDVLAKSPTGSGKTLAFGLPLVERIAPRDGTPSTLVLTPTRELAAQVAEELAALGTPKGLVVATAYGGAPMRPQVKRLHGAHIVVATPGRLQDLVERGHVSLARIRVLVLDEADRMLDMGFAPQINRVVEQIPPYRQTVLFSATMPPEVEALARKYLRKPLVVQVGRRSMAANTVTHAVYPVPREKKSALLVELLNKPDMDSVLVFTRTKHGADRVVRHLERAGVAAKAMHADKTQVQRSKALEGFKDGSVRVLVATDIAQRGLDISGISHVINYDVPQQAEDYVHRIGRTGRAAATGDAFTFMSPDEIPMVRTIERLLGQPIPRISVSGYDFGTVAAD